MLITGSGSDIHTYTHHRGLNCTNILNELNPTLKTKLENVSPPCYMIYFFVFTILFQINYLFYYLEGHFLKACYFCYYSDSVYNSVLSLLLQLGLANPFFIHFDFSFSSIRRGYLCLCLKLWLNLLYFGVFLWILQNIKKEKQNCGKGYKINNLESDICMPVADIQQNNNTLGPLPFR